MNTVTADSIQISEEVGSVSCEIITPEKPIAVISLAHGAGAGMNHPFMIQLANALVEKNIATVRFNFPYMERGKRRPDSPALGELTIASALDYVKNKFSNVPIFLGGKSFGGRMSSQWLSKNPDASVSGILFFGFPLHPAGKPSVTRADHLFSIQHPMLFLQGTKDTLADLSLLRSVVSKAPKATLITFEGANHGFQIGKRLLVTELADAATQWIREQGVD